MMDRILSKRSPLLLRSSAVGTLLALTLAGAVLPIVAVAQVPAPAERGDKVLPPIEILAELVGDSVRCSPAEVRLPAQDEIDLRLVNRSDQPLTFAGQEIFSDRYLVRLEGDVVHAASDQGYVVEPMPPGGSSCERRLPASIAIPAPAAGPRAIRPEAR
jgi:hypothetical protein